MISLTSHYGLQAKVYQALGPGQPPGRALGHAGLGTGAGAERAMGQAQSPSPLGPHQGSSSAPGARAAWYSLTLSI
jgi:hypothetical protein